MRYVVAGYVFVLGLLALYALQLAWRRRRLSRAVARVAVPAGAAAVAPSGPVAPGAAGVAAAGSPEAAR